MMRIWIALISLTFTASAAGAASTAVENYETVKEKIRSNEQTSREIMAKLYQINNRMKKVSKRRTVITYKALATEAKLRKLTASVKELDFTIDDQRKRLAKRLRTIYMLGQDKLARAMFSAGNSEDLQRTLKFLKLFTQQDYHLIKTYQSNLAILQNKNDTLNQELRKLVSLRKQLHKQEITLDLDQSQKSKFLAELNKQNKRQLQNLRSIRQSLPQADQLLNLSFFEKKGKLQPPLQAEIARDFGIIENSKYGYQLSHKGILYRVRRPSKVSAIHEGKVVFVESIDGYGNTIILDHGDNYYSVYAGLEDIKVESGQAISDKQELAGTSDQLYFELRHFSDAIDPKTWFLQARGDS